MTPRFARSLHARPPSGLARSLRRGFWRLVEQFRKKARLKLTPLISRVAELPQASYVLWLGSNEGEGMNLRNLAIWGVIAVVVVGLYTMMNQSAKTGASGEVSYSQLLG